MTEKLQAALMRVVDGDDRHSVVTGHIAGADVLQVAAKVHPADGVVVEDMHESLRPATELDIGPSGLADGRKIEAVTFTQVFLLDVCQRVRARRHLARGAFTVIERLAAVVCLNSANVVGERDRPVVLADRRLRSCAPRAILPEGSALQPAEEVSDIAADFVSVRFQSEMAGVE